MSDIKITFRDKIKRIILVKDRIKSMVLSSIELPANVNSLGKNFVLVDRYSANYPFITQELVAYGRKFSRYNSDIFPLKGTNYKVISGRVAYGKEVRALHYKAGYYLPAIEKLNEILAQAELEVGTTISITQTMPDEHLIKLEEILFSE